MQIPVLLNVVLVVLVSLTYSPNLSKKVLGNFFGKALQSALRMIHIALRMIHNALWMIQLLKQFMIYLYIYHKAT